MRAILVLILSLAAYSAAQAQTFIVQGSTTFDNRVMVPLQAAIEQESGHRLTVVPNKSSLGLLALFDRRADFAMISGPLQNEIDALKPNHPNLPFDQLQTFNVWNTRMAFAVNKNNPLRSLSSDKMREILLGHATNWRQVGGSDLPIRLVQVREGGGVQASIEGAILDGQSISAPNEIYVQISSQVVKIVEQLPEGLGLSQLGIVRRSNTVELKLDRPVEQHLDLVTLGDPTREMRRVIEAAHHVASTAFEQ